jgi:L-ascorbate metabolism protein UlaG (beta-lactamase superfamily)
MRILKRIGTALLFIVVAICLAPTLVPPFLDRIYYRGPPSGHFDGQRFFNPGFQEVAHGSPTSFINRVLRGEGRAEWPEQVPVKQGLPSAGATLCPQMKGAVVENWRRCVDEIDPKLMTVTWVGHSSVLVQAGGLNILTDPIWSERASPFSFVGPKRVRAPGIRFEDLPRIDLVLISHNHYDHMDLPTLKRLWERDRPLIVTSLGNDTVIAKAGVPSLALDWGESQYVPFACVRPQSAEGVANYRQVVEASDCSVPGATVTVLRNHHWGSRWGTDRNRALWSAFKVQTPAGSIFFAGDTGWGDGSWVREAAGQGPYRLAIIPIGAYEPRDFMKSNHINPEEAVRIFEMLKPAQALGVHWGTFQLTFEPIDEPRQKLKALKRQRGIPASRFIATEAGQSFTVPTGG